MAPPIKTPNPSARKPLTAERLREVLHYDPETGIFTWRVRANCNGALVGDRAGHHKPDGYLIISIDRHRYRAHHLVWLYVMGEWPTDEIDHKNLIRDDNRWSNLREATHAQNNQNTRRRCDNTSGFKGVFFCKFTGKWRARIAANKKLHEVGRFDTPEAAAEARADAAARLHGDFVRAI